MCLFPGALDKMLGMKPLAGKPPLHVDEAGQHGVDRAGRGFRFQILERDRPRHGHLLPPIDPLICLKIRLACHNNDASHFRDEMKQGSGGIHPVIVS